MRRDGINLRSAGCDSEVTKPKLLDSNSKRTNNKITIYSQKYTNLMSTHSLPEDAQHIFSTTSTLKSDSRSVKFHDSRQVDNAQRYTQSSQKSSYSPKATDQGLLATIRAELGLAKEQYEARVKGLMEANARTISELRQTLCEQQRQLLQKQQIIYGLLNSKKLSGKATFGDTQASKKIKLGEYLYLKDKVQDLESRAKILLETLATTDAETATRIQHIEEKLLRHYGSKMARYRSQLALIASALSQKLEKLSACLIKIQNYPKKNTKPSLESMQSQIQKFKVQMASITTKQFSQQTPGMFELQTVLRSLTQKVDKAWPLDLREEMAFDDDDEFFYPQSERLYGASDDYEHFQSDSDEEREKKQNKPFNGQWSGCKFSI